MDQSQYLNVESLGRATVLLIDDQLIVAAAVQRLVAGEEDILLEYCANPMDALAIANKVNPTIILLDLVMPQANGLDLLHTFRANELTEQTPVIVLSSQEDAYLKSVAFAAGANDYLVKLPDKLEFLARLRYHSNAHLRRLQRDQAFQALRLSQQALIDKNNELVTTNLALEQAVSEVKQLQGLLPICGRCKQVRDDNNYWHRIETYMCSHSHVTFTHGLCPDCLSKQLHELDQLPQTPDCL